MAKLLTCALLVGLILFGQALLRKARRQIMRRFVIAACACFVIAVLSLPGDVLAQAPIIQQPFNFRENRGGNSLFGSGDRLSFGATSITPSGPQTTATATQGSTTLPLNFDPLTLFPNEYDRRIRFDPSLTGSWMINAMGPGGSAIPVPTNPIPNPELLPLVQNLRVVGTGLTPTLTWDLPDLTGLGVDRIRVRISRINADGSRDQFFQSANLPATTTTFQVPPGVLQDGGTYVTRIMLDDLQTATGFGTFLANRSSTFTKCGTAPFGARRDFVTRLFCEILARGPDPGGLAFWESTLGAQCNAKGFAAIAENFFDSEELRSVRALSLKGLVGVLYRTFLGREPDAGGVAFWGDVIRQGRLLVATDGFIASAEFRSLVPDRTNQAAVTDVVTRFYTEVLGRAPEPDGLAFWVNHVVATRDLEGAARSFLASPEFEARALTLRDNVRIFFRTFLGRDPDPGGSGFWELVLVDGLLDILESGFVPSPEFQGLVPQVCA